MKKKEKYVVAVLLVIILLANSVEVFAAEKNVANNMKQVISIDAKNITSETGKTLEEVLGLKD